MLPVAVLVYLCVSESSAFGPPIRYYRRPSAARGQQRRGWRRRGNEVLEPHQFRLWALQEDSIEYVEQLESEKTRLTAALDSMEGLRQTLTNSTSLQEVQAIKGDVDLVESEIADLSRSPIPPKGLSMEEYGAAIRLFLTLPITLRMAFCEVLDLKDDSLTASTDWKRVPALVSALYEDRQRLTPLRMKEAVRSARTIRKQRASSARQSEVQQRTPGDRDGTGNNLLSIFSEDASQEDRMKEGTIQQLLPRVTRRDGRVAMAEDLNQLVAVLSSNKELFAVTGTEPISGGYIVRGRSQKASGEALMEALESKLPSGWSSQVCFVPDISNQAESIGEDPDPVLMLFKKDMSPATSRWILSLITSAAVVSAFLYAFGVFGGNETVLDRLTAQTEAGDYSGFTWFNGKVLEVVLPLAIVQVAHELGHIVIAAKEKISFSPPTLLPFWSLPFLGAQTHIKESPRDLTSLFDFAIVGPILGLFVSLGLLVFGLQATGSMDAEAVQYLPQLPVRVIQASTLGGTLVDTFLGGEGAVTLQDPKTGIPLHPFAIAGFLSLMIQSLDLLPLGSTDGGRVSLSLFGRRGHSVAGGIVWFSLLSASLVVDNADILLGAWVVNNIAQNDPEIPCRNEVDPVDLPRGVFAFALWFFALLVITPMSILAT